MDVNVAGSGPDWAFAAPETDGWSSGLSFLEEARAGSELSSVPGMQVEHMNDGRGQVRVGVMEPTGVPRADVLFLHGFADRFDNHLPLFEAWRDMGMRVVAFDFPSHGETRSESIGSYGFSGLGELAGFVEERTRTGDRPLLVSGWSTGGLLAVRLLQEDTLTRPVEGAVLFTPGVDVKTIVGRAGFVTQDTLTRNPEPPHRGPISPWSPLFAPGFALDLLKNAGASRASAYPADVPTLVFTAGVQTDRYVDTQGVQEWVAARQAEGAKLYGRACEGGFHELDNEPAPMGSEVRLLAAEFAAWAAGPQEGQPPVLAPGVCRPY